MAKINSLRRILLPCFTTTTTSSSATTTTTNTTTKKRLSTSLRDDNKTDQETISITRKPKRSTTSPDDLTASPSPSSSPNTHDHHIFFSTPQSIVPPRPSKSMVVCTFFGPRRSHVWFCVQLDRLSTKPSLLLELSLSTQNLIREMRSGLVRIALECASGLDGIGVCPLRSVPVWTMYCNGRRVGFASRRKVSEDTRLMLKSMQSMTVGAGVIPPTAAASSGCETGCGPSGMGGEEVMYMRANYEWIVGGADSESFHLINPESDDNCSGQELSVFLMRSR